MGLDAIPRNSDDAGVALEIAMGGVSLAYFQIFTGFGKRMGLHRETFLLMELDPDVMFGALVRSWVGK